MTVGCTACLLFVITSVAPSSSPQLTSVPAGVWQRSEAGQTLILPMVNAPYPHASRQNGWKIRDSFYPRDPHYVDNSVGVFIPAGYRAGEATDLLFYFHGHLNNIRKAFDDYKLREQIAATGKNVIAVFPEAAKNAEDSGGGKLDEKGGLKRLADEVLDRLVADGKLPSRKLGRVLLAGHSGAYRVISHCLDQSGLDDHISDVCLLDSTYDRLDAFVSWAARRSTGRLFSLFTDHLAAENVHIMTHLHKKGIAYELHAEQDATPEIVRRSRVLFLHGEQLKHETTVQWLQRWMAATNLPTTTAPASR